MRDFNEEPEEHEDTDPSTGFLSTDLTEFFELAISKGKALNLPTNMANIVNDFIGTFIKDREFYRQILMDEYKQKQDRYGPVSRLL